MRGVTLSGDHLMTAMSRDNIPSAINTLEGLMAWAMLTYTAANGHTSYSETSAVDVQRLASYGVSPVRSEIGGSSLMLIGRFAVPLNNNILSSGAIAWNGVVENPDSTALPPGYAL